jgi:hypothetical protein
MRAPSDGTGSSSVTEAVGHRPDSAETPDATLKSENTPHTDQPNTHSAQAANAAWLKEVDRRISDAESSTRRAQKHSMVWGGIALVLAAVGLALVVNRLSSDPFDGKYGEAGVTLLKPDTLIWLTVYAAVFLIVTAAFLSVIAIHLRYWRNESPGSPWRNWWVWLVAAFMVAAYGNFLKVSRALGSDPSGAFRLGHGSLGAALLVTALGLFMISLYYGRKVRHHEQDITDLQFEQDLLRHGLKPYQTRAEKLLSVNQIQLRRYYELNLEQAKAVFFVGIGCIGAGLVVVGVTFWLIFWLGGQPDQQNAIYTQAIVAILGVIGSVLTNFIAFTYLKIHGSISKSLLAFHRQLAAIHDLFFANVLVASVEPDTRRAETLIRLASAIAEHRVTEPTPSAKVA